METNTENDMETGGVKRYYNGVAAWGVGFRD